MERYAALSVSHGGALLRLRWASLPAIVPRHGDDMGAWSDNAHRISVSYNRPDETSRRCMKNSMSECANVFVVQADCNRTMNFC